MRRLYFPAWSVVALVALVGVVAGCGGAKAPDGGAHVVLLLVDERGERLPFDPEAIRAQRAREALDSVTRAHAGGKTPVALELQVDVALLPPDREGREGYLADTMESLARALDELGRGSPAAYAAAASRLRRVAFRFDPLARRMRITLSDDGETLEARSDRPGQALLQSADYTYLLRDRARDVAWARYAKRDPEAVPRAERDAYLDALLHGRPTGARDRDDDGAAGAERVLRLLRLHELAGAEHDEPLVGRVRHALVSSGGDLFREIAHQRPEVFDRAAPTSPLRRAERGYARFLVGALRDLDDSDALAAVRAGFARASRADAPVTRYVLPSFDRVEVALALLGAWRAGRTAAEAPALHFVVCPEERVRSGNRVVVSHSSYCSDELYRMARTDPGALEALTRYAVRTGDAAFTRLLFARLPREGERSEALGATKSLFGTRLFPVAIDALAGAVEGTGDAELVASARDLVRELPAARGDVAYLLARALTLRASTPVFTRFEELFAAPLELTDFERFMAYGEPAVQSFAAVLPAFAKRARGVPRARVFLVKLDAYLDRADERRAERGPDTTLSELRDGLCADDDDAARAEIGKAIAARRRTHPGEGLTELFAEPCPRRSLQRPAAKRPTIDRRDGGPETDLPAPFALPRQTDLPRAPRPPAAPGSPAAPRKPRSRPDDRR